MANSTSFSTRMVQKASSALSRRSTSRRSFLAKTAVVGSAIAVNPITYLVRPGTAYASLCGDGAGCDSGWTAFCCSVNGGYNSCPPGSFVAGWWKADYAAYCCGAARYIIDCNATVPVQCGCTCASYGCDQRRTCCNQFRYGQCHQEIGAYGPVVCRIATCTPPWLYDASCTSASATDNATVNQGSPCLPENDCAPPPPPPASNIDNVYAFYGGANGILGPVIRPEGPTPDGAGRYALYNNGGIWDSPGTGTHAVQGRIVADYAAYGYSISVLGFPLSEEQPTPDGYGRYSTFQGGEIYWSGYTDAHAVYGQIGNLYRFYGSTTTPLGYPITDELPVGDGIGRYNAFQHGEIYWSFYTGPFEVLDDIASVYRYVGGPRSVLGYPVGHQSPTNGGGVQSRFQNGSITRTPFVGTFIVHGAIWGRYQALGAEGGELGLPLSHELDAGVPYAKMSRFQNGTIYWHPYLGPHEVYGQNDLVYRYVGGPRSSLGLPNADPEITVGGGLANYFATGAIYGKAGVGTFLLDGDIASVYRYIGGPASPLGYPIDHIKAVGDGRGRTAVFQNGGLWSTSSTGVGGTWGPIAVKYNSLGGPTGSLGYPTSFVFAVPGGQRTTFEHGTLTLDSSTGVVTRT